MLFATLDPTMRGVELPDGTDVILSDTVGFISDLPTQLVAAFRATLEEVLDADLILHVRDISHPETEEQAAEVHAILRDLGVAETAPMLEVWNKVDLVRGEAATALPAMAARRPLVFPVSALTGEGLGPLLAAVSEALAPPRHRAEVRLGHSDGRRRAWLYEQGVVEGEEAGDDETRIVVNWTARQEQAFRRL
jgi:GTP-binding protein HflX